MLRIGGAYWRSERKATIRTMSLLLFVLTVAQVGLSVWGNYWNRRLFDALEAHSVHRVLIQAGVFALIFASAIVVTAAHLIVKRWLQLDWRTWLTDRLIGSWLEGGRHYRLAFTPGEHDNPDQRIAENIHLATDLAIELLHTLVFSILSLVSYVDILWSVSGTMAVPGTSLNVPGYMVPLAFLYAGVGALLGRLLGRPLVRTTNALQSAEADYRFGLAHVREHAEAVALMRGEPIERRSASHRFSEIARKFDRQSIAYMGLTSFETAYGELMPVFPLLIAAPQYILGAMSLGVLMQAAQAFQRLAWALSWPVSNVGVIAECRASAERVLSLYQDLQRLDAETRAERGERIALERDAPCIEIDALRIIAPDGVTVLDHLDATIEAGEHVHVTGDPYLTSALFKVLGGLWSDGRGRVRLPADETTSFVAQRPFFPDGTLRDALCYPRPADAFTDDAIRAALARAGLEWLAARLDATEKWEQSLSLPAQQRLSFARVLLHRPAWVMMEEATSAFDPSTERQLIEAVFHALPRTAWVAFGVHPLGDRLFDRKIVLASTRPPTPGRERKIEP